MSPSVTPKVSVIVPVYNTELYVERAIVSLMEQTLDNVQFIIIDDGSKDNSLNIIKQVISRYPERKEHVTLISRENRGVAATRAQGMELATGDYVIHLDSDDWAELNWLEMMYNKAIAEDADVVVCDYYAVFENRRAISTQKVTENNIECVKMLLACNISNSNWDKLVKRSLFDENEIFFHSGYDMGEDFLVTLLVFMKARKTAHLNTALYYYNRVNESSLTKRYSPKSLCDLLKITNLAEQALENSGFTNMVENEMNIFKLNVMSLFITHSSQDVDKIKYAFNLYPTTNKKILSSKMKMLKIIYVLKKMRLLFFCKYLFRVRGFLQGFK